jgi:hypothetical protein
VREPAREKGRSARWPAESGPETERRSRAAAAADRRPPRATKSHRAMARQRVHSRPAAGQARLRAPPAQLWRRRPPRRRWAEPHSSRLDRRAERRWRRPPPPHWRSARNFRRGPVRLSLSRANGGPRLFGQGPLDRGSRAVYDGARCHRVAKRLAPFAGHVCRPCPGGTGRASGHRRIPNFQTATAPRLWHLTACQIAADADEVPARAASMVCG